MNQLRQYLDRTRLNLERVDLARARLRKAAAEAGGRTLTDAVREALEVIPFGDYLDEDTDSALAAWFERELEGKTTTVTALAGAYSVAKSTLRTRGPRGATVTVKSGGLPSETWEKVRAHVSALEASTQTRIAKRRPAAKRTPAKSPFSEEVS